MTTNSVLESKLHCDSHFTRLHVCEFSLHSTPHSSDSTTIPGTPTSVIRTLVAELETVFEERNERQEQVIDNSTFQQQTVKGISNLPTPHAGAF